MHGPFHNLHLLGCDRAVTLHSSQLRQQRFQLFPEHRIRGPTAAAARTREAASPWESWNIRIRNWVRLEKQ